MFTRATLLKYERTKKNTISLGVLDNGREDDPYNIYEVEIRRPSYCKEKEEHTSELVLREEFSTLEEARKQFNSYLECLTSKKFGGDYPKLDAYIFDGKGLLYLGSSCFFRTQREHKDWILKNVDKCFFTHGYKPEDIKRSMIRIKKGS